jgi:hypothetical protein
VTSRSHGLISVFQIGWLPLVGRVACEILGSMVAGLAGAIIGVFQTSAIGSSPKYLRMLRSVSYYRTGPSLNLIEPGYTCHQSLHSFSSSVELIKFAILSASHGHST